MEKLRLNKGFTMIEFLMVLIILAIVNNLYLNNIDFKKIKEKSNLYKVEFKLLDYKVEALSLRKRQCLSDNLIISSKEICFNERSNVNMAQTVNILNSNKQIIIHLGAGVYEIK